MSSAVIYQSYAAAAAVADVDDDAVGTSCKVDKIVIGSRPQHSLVSHNHSQCRLINLPPTCGDDVNTQLSPETPAQHNCRSVK